MLQAKKNSMMFTSKLNDVTLGKVIEYVSVNKSKYTDFARLEGGDLTT